MADARDPARLLVVLLLRPLTPVILCLVADFVDAAGFSRGFGFDFGFGFAAMTFPNVLDFFGSVSFAAAFASLLASCDKFAAQM